MSDDSLNAICFYMGGSWVYQALHNISHVNKRVLLLEFIDNVGQDVLDETITYIKNNHEGPMPKWLEQRCSVS